MTSPTGESEMFSDEALAVLARQVEPHDHDRIAPPPMVWNNIVEELRHETSGDVASDPTAPLSLVAAKAQRRWFASAQVLSIAAAVVLVAIIGGIAVLQSGGDSSEQLAMATMTDEGLPVATAATAQARVVCRADDCVVEVDLSSIPDAGDADLELWVINGDVTDMHSLGLVRSSGTFELPFGVTPADFPIVDISVEPRDGVAAHSGQSVLRGVFEQI